MEELGEIMFIYNDIKIHYKDYGDKSKDAIVYLHGWGQNIQMMEPIANPLAKTNRLVILDLPGFGESEEPKTVWTLDDFVEMIHALLKSLNIECPYLVGHSFGGKLSILYASKYDVKRLVLLSSPYKVKIQKVSMKVKILKALKKIPGLGALAEVAKKFMGSTDYRNASPMMRDILVKHVNTDLTEEVKKIDVPTFIIWGDQDLAVDVEDAYELEKLLKDAGLVVYEGCTHYAYLERAGQTINILKEFFK